jgi:diketogulonate reductase-like aldo/keto reductase
MLEEIGSRYDKSAAQVALRWEIQKPRVATIPKAASPEHREANLDIFDFELADEDMRAIDTLAEGERIIDPGFAPDWEHPEA